MKRILAFLMAALLAAGTFGALAEEAASTVDVTVNLLEVEADEPSGGVAPTPTPYQPLRYGDQGELVGLVQQRLSELGYYTGSISGNFLDGTRAAVRRFQKEYGLEETGEVDGETEAVLMNAEYRILAHGDDGDEVTRVQERLKELGYLSANATGKFRDATQAAVRMFQENNGISATGQADVETQRVLFSSAALAKGAQPTPTPDPESDLGDINDVVIVADGEATSDSEGETAYTKKLSRGSKGEQVKQVQTRLTELGFFSGPISGNYMNQTLAAVKAFQEHNGMNADGITGRETWDMMFNSTEVLDTSATARPTPVPTPVPYAITVDVNNQATIVYTRDENGDFTVPYKYMICSTGLKATPSDVGDWIITGRKARWCYFPAWGGHAQYWTRINASIAFHSVTYREVSYDAMNVKSYNKLGQRASHGCIRLLVNDAKWIYDNIGEGVVVTITEDLPKDEELRKAIDAPPLNKSKTGPVSTPEPTPEPEYVSGGMPPQPFRKLKKGSEGEDVYWLQRKLKDLGYYTGTVTGGYYSGTASAVKAWQKDNGIYPTGDADEKTLEAIYAGILAQNTATPEPTPEATPKPEQTIEAEK